MIALPRRGRIFSSLRRAATASGGLLALLTAALLASLPGSLAAFSDEDIDALLALPEPPDGVVFEIVEAEKWALADLLPRVREAVERIRARYPDTEFAVVSHGREEFALQTRYQDEYAEIHRQVQSLVADDVPVHVCETHANWMGVTAEDFPDYVDVAPAGPAQVSLYQELGFYLIVVE
jgi:intracellular sulfur oxidation DsrE/DsrF family protein